MPSKGLAAVRLSKLMRMVGEPRVVWEAFAHPDTEPSRLAFQSRAAGVSVHALAEDPFQAGTFYAYLDGILESGAGVYHSRDWGETWQRLANPFPTFIGRIPHQRHWIENELLSVVIAQTKNVCGTNQLLCLDPHRQGTIYVGEWTEGLFRSNDSGQSWKRIGESLPFQRDHASVLNVIRADENQPGVVYAGFIREGVWRSADYGDTWQKSSRRMIASLTRHPWPLAERMERCWSSSVSRSTGHRVSQRCG
ncbi:exo-alpha-sialidase [bacterium]|nr:exo-alpha-sialidase [bacterium]